MRFSAFCIALVLLNFVCGCAKQTAIEGVVPVTGIVRYQNEPVAGATVIFSPEGETRAASCITDADGRFQLTTLEAGDGALPGQYRVAIFKTEIINPLSQKQAQAYFHEHAGRMPPVKTRQLLPEKYRQASTSKLVAQVAADNTNDFEFNLAD